MNRVSKLGWNDWAVCLKVVLLYFIGKKVQNQTFCTLYKTKLADTKVRKPSIVTLTSTFLGQNRLKTPIELWDALVTRADQAKINCIKFASKGVLPVSVVFQRCKQQYQAMFHLELLE